MCLTKNTNFLLILLFVLIIFISIVCGENKFRCCPRNSKLIINHENNNVNYQCESIDQDEKNSTDLDVENKNSLLFQSFSFYEDEFQHFPICESHEMFIEKIEGESISVSSENCVDLIDSLYHVIYCQNSLDIKEKIIQFRKCCPKYYIYDLNNRECVENIDISQNFEHLIQNELNVFSTGPPICDLSKDDVIVEYKSNVHGLSFDNMRLKIDDGAPYGGLNSFCIERTLDDVFIAQVCERRSICKKIPCVRKCCNYGEKIYKQDYDVDAKCVSESKMFSPEFYNLGQIKEGSEEFVADRENVEG